MPSERFTSAEFDFADLLVIWPQQNELADHGSDLPPEKPYVNLAPVAPSLHKGGIAFHPDKPEDFGLNAGEGVGPVGTKLDRAGVNRLITTLRQARDEAFGADA